MTHRPSRSLLLFLALAIACGLSSCAAPSAPLGRPASALSPEAQRLPWRGMFVTRWDIRSAAGVDQIIDNAASIGVTDLFLQVRGAGDLIYPGPEPLAPHLSSAERTDLLARAISTAHERGLRVHAWVNVLTLEPSAAPRPSRNIAHPEWILWGEKVPIVSDDGYILMDPAVPEAREHVRVLLTDLLARYALDGVCLDYLRLPAMSPEDRSAWKSRHDAAANADAAAESIASSPEEWAAAQVDQLAQDLSQAVRDQEPGVMLSVVCPKTPEESARLLQSPASWARERTVDALIVVVPSDLPAVPAELMSRWADLSATTKLIAALSPADARTPDTLRAQWQSLGRRPSFAWFTYAGVFESPDPGQPSDPKSSQRRAAQSELLRSSFGPRRPRIESTTVEAAPISSSEEPPPSLDPLDPPPESSAPPATIPVPQITPDPPPSASDEIPLAPGEIPDAPSDPQPDPPPNPEPRQ
jgi:uncharacterized lipoprotein YddW (UPF0748 family)